MALCRDAVADCFDQAKVHSHNSQDEYGHRRSNEIGSAVTVLKVTAKLGAALAKIRGGSFDHRVTVTRDTAPALATGEG